jgi:hypothetical protein
VSVGYGAGGLPLSAAKLILVAIYFEHHGGLRRRLRSTSMRLSQRGCTSPPNSWKSN